MEKFKRFVDNLTESGVQVILISWPFEKFDSISRISIVEDWSDSWEVVDKTVGENRKILFPHWFDDSLFEQDAVEFHVQAALLDEGMLWFKFNVSDMSREEMQISISEFKHVVVMLDGNDLYTSFETLTSKQQNTEVKDFIITPNYSSPLIEEFFYYSPKGLTVIINWPRRIDRELFIDDNN